MVNNGLVVILHTDDYSIAYQADVVIEVVNALELTQYHIYGHSMGGSIAIEVAK